MCVGSGKGFPKGSWEAARSGNHYPQEFIRGEILQDLELPWWSSGWDYACRFPACRGHRPDPGPGRRFHIPQGNSACAAELLSPHSRALMLQVLKPECPRARALQQEKPLKWEAHVLQLEYPRLPQLEKVHVGQQKPRRAKKIIKKVKKKKKYHRT